jgi:hypothetical protein
MDDFRARIGAACTFSMVSGRDSGKLVVNLSVVIPSH